MLSASLNKTFLSLSFLIGKGNQYLCVYICEGSNTPAMSPETDKAGQSPRGMEAAVTVEISKLLICLCGFDLFCPLRDKNNSIENLYIALSCPIK